MHDFGPRPSYSTIFYASISSKRSSCLRFWYVEVAASHAHFKVEVGIEGADRR
jgi:hypothetical protein